MNIAETLRKQQENTGYLEGVRNVLMGVIAPTGGALTTLIHEATAIKAATDAIREKLVEYGVSAMDETIDFLPQKIDDVYDAGKQIGKSEFWDKYQDYGNITQYEQAFVGDRWNDETFTPKYDMNLSYWGGNQMFYKCGIVDLKGALEKCGVTLNTKNCHAFNGCFQDSKTKIIPILDLTNADYSTNYMFATKAVETIEKIISSVNTNHGTYMFQNATALTDITFEGVIAKNIDIHWSPLSKASILSIIEHLSDTASGQTLTLSKAAKEAAFGDTEWAELIATKPNWSVSLA